MQKRGTPVVLRVLLLVYVVSVPYILLLFVTTYISTRRERRQGETDRAQTEQSLSPEHSEGRLKEDVVPQLKLVAPIREQEDREAAG